LTSSDDLMIASLGAATPIGRSAWACAAAARAGLTGFASHPYMVDAVGLPIRVAALPWITPERSIVERICDALLSALREALVPLQQIQPRPPIMLLLNLPPARPGLPVDLARQIGARLREQLGGLFERVSVATLGHAGALVGLQSAKALLEARPDAMCVIAGADSYLEPDLLEWLEQTDQLHGAGERNNAWGFIPGEGAGAFLVAAPSLLRRLALAPMARVRGIGVAREAELIGTGSVCTGVGLTAAVRGAVVGGLHEGEQLSDVYCDMNGEPYRADEYAFLVTRTREHFVAASEFVSPADCWGDVGAASGPLLVALACIAGVKRYSKGHAALVWASSVNGERAAVLLETAAPA